MEYLEPRLLLTTGYGGAFQLYTDATRNEPGLVGSYVNESLRSVDELDWRLTREISGQRVDELFFTTDSFGARREVGVTGGSDLDWEQFSVQWDGVVEIVEEGARLATRSDDGSRFWIDIDQDAAFEDHELFDNGWGTGHPVQTGETTPPLPTGIYGIRVQFEEGVFGNPFSLLANPVADAPDLILRVAYVIPQNRVEQPEGAENLRDFLPRMSRWYAEQLERHGFGPKSFRFETEADGTTPKIHVTHVGVDDAHIREDTWSNTIRAATAAGLDVWAPGTIWLLIPESHVQNPDGSSAGGVALGASFGSGRDPGVAMLGSDSLFRLSEDRLRDDRLYAGHVVPEFGPYPLVQDVSYPWFELNTFSSIASSIQGAVAHEVGHAFGLNHDFRNDENFRGNLMGNGLRGFRGATLSAFYPADDTRLSHGAALALNSSRYFNWSEPSSDSTRPHVTVATEGAVDPRDGLVHVDFTASDDEGLAVALLRRNGDTIAEKVLSGTSTTDFFATPFYDPGVESVFEVSVYDTSGNRSNASSRITPRGGANLAPRPAVRVLSSQPRIGESVSLDASLSVDPDGSDAALLVEWDLDGDGTYDLGPSTNTVEVTFQQLGNRHIVARLTDSAGAQSVSSPIAVRVGSQTAPVANDDAVEAFEDVIVTLDVLGNDFDADGDSLAIVPGSLSDPAHGSVELNLDGTISYTPDWNYHGADAFTYEVTDGRAVDQAMVSLSVTDVDDVPVRPVASLVTLESAATGSSYVLTADEAGMLDAWVDFNGDGDWDESNERIEANRPIQRGENLLSFTIPAGAMAATVTARFRVSASGGLEPDAPNRDGALEDHQLEVLDGQVPVEILVNPPAGETWWTTQSGDLIATWNGMELFRAAEASVGAVEFLGSDGDDVLSIATTAFQADGGLPLTANLAGGFDSIRLLGDGVDLVCDALPPGHITNVERLDARGGGANRLTKLTREVVVSLTDSHNVLQVFTDFDDEVEIGESWELDTPTFVDGVFYRRLKGSSLLLHGPAHWQNPVRPLDINGDGTVAPIDALILINKINASGSGPLPTPTENELPPHYFDPTGDGNLAPVDVLVVIDFINSRLGR